MQTQIRCTVRRGAGKASFSFLWSESESVPSTEHVCTVLEQQGETPTQKHGFDIKDTYLLAPVCR